VFVSEFQTNAGSVSYRAIIHVATTNASAWTLNIVNVFAQNNSVQPFVSLQDKQYDLTVTSTNWTTTRAVGIPYKTRDGAWRLRFNFRGLYSSAIANQTFAISGVVFKNIAGFAQACVISYDATGGGGGAGGTEDIAQTNPGTNQIGWGYSTTRTGFEVSGDVELDSMPTWAVDYYPQQLGDGAETRVVAFNANVANYLLTAGVDSIFDLVSVQNDTHGGIDLTNNEYVIKVVGYYVFTGQVGIASITSADTYFWHIERTKVGGGVDQLAYFGSQQPLTGATGDVYIPLTSKPTLCNVGDKIRFRYSINNARTVYAGPENTFFSGYRLSGPATIAAPPAQRGDPAEHPRP